VGPWALAATIIGGGVAVAGAALLLVGVLSE
jgi:hypothetical protein